MLVNLKEILEDTRKKHYAVGAFNTPTLESLRAVIEVAEDKQVPVIISHAEVHEELVPIEIIGPIMVQLAKEAKVKVCVHLDHGKSIDMIKRAMKIGFTSIMYDGSEYSYESNIKQTKRVVELVHPYNISVEAELGSMLGAEGVANGEIDLNDKKMLEKLYTNPAQAKEFVERTGIDALAIAFGTVHGIYTREPRLDIERVAQIREQVDVPLVMHGGSGVSDEEVQKAIENGISKINYYTYMALAGGEDIRQLVQYQEKNLLFHDIAQRAKEAMKLDVSKTIGIFENKKSE